MLGHSHSDRAEGKALNRVLGVCSDDWKIEACTRHAELIVGQMGVTDGKGVFGSRSTRQE